MRETVPLSGPQVPAAVAARSAATAPSSAALTWSLPCRAEPVSVVLGALLVFKGSAADVDQA